MKTRLFAVLLLAAVCATACTTSPVPYYELEGGDPEFDFIYFPTDSTCRFMDPNIQLTEYPYEIVSVDEGDYIVVHVAPYSQGVLKIIDEKTMEGSAPFFEGIWKKVRHPHRKPR